MPQPDLPSRPAGPPFGPPADWHPSRDPDPDLPPRRSRRPRATWTVDGVTQASVTPWWGRPVIWLLQRLVPHGTYVLQVTDAYVFRVSGPEDAAVDPLLAATRLAHGRVPRRDGDDG